MRPVRLLEWDQPNRGSWQRPILADLSEVYLPGICLYAVWKLPAQVIQVTVIVCPLVYVLSQTSCVSLVALTFLLLLLIPVH